MVVEAVTQAQAATAVMLASVDSGTASVEELREALAQSRSVMANVTAFQTSAAELIAKRERHGDGGAEILASSAGMSQREAHSQVKTAEVLRKVPKLREAVQSGEVSQANARRLADVINKTGADVVAGDCELLDQASKMRPEQFLRTANRWVSAQQADKGASEHSRQRARRYLWFFDCEDGMIGLKGEFDKVTGQRIRNRLEATAKRFFEADRQLPKTQQRKFDKCLADALQHHTSSRSSDTTQGVVGGGWQADISVVAHVDEAAGELIAELSDGSKLPSEVLDELSCNARWTGLVFDHCGDAIWRSRSRRTVTDTQWQTLLAIYGGCFHCGAPPGICQAHHITAYSRGGDTSLKNLIMVCWSCHHKIHHHNWRIREHPDGSHTLHPPDQTPRYGPAHAEDPEPENPLHQARARAPARVQASGASRALVSRSKGRTSARARAPDPNMLW